MVQFSVKAQRNSRWMEYYAEHRALKLPLINATVTYGYKNDHNSSFTLRENLRQFQETKLSIQFLSI